MIMDHPLSATKGVTTKRRHPPLIRQPTSLLQESENHKSSTDLSPKNANIMYSQTTSHKKHKDSTDRPTYNRLNSQFDPNAKQAQPRSTQVAGNAIVLGNSPSKLHK